MNLIYDRTEIDYKAAYELAKIPWRKMNTGQRAQWSGFMKGRYTYEDLNRVETAVGDIASRMAILPSELDEYASDNGASWDRGELPYDPDRAASVSVKTDWAVSDMFPSTQRERYLANVRFIHDAFAPKIALPVGMEGINWTDANNIEAALFAADAALTSLKEKIISGMDEEITAFKLHSGELYSGEV